MVAWRIRHHSHNSSFQSLSSCLFLSCPGMWIPGITGHYNSHYFPVTSWIKSHPYRFAKLRVILAGSLSLKEFMGGVSDWSVWPLTLIPIISFSSLCPTYNAWMTSLLPGVMGQRFKASWIQECGRKLLDSQDMAHMRLMWCAMSPRMWLIHQSINHISANHSFSLSSSSIPACERLSHGSFAVL